MPTPKTAPPSPLTTRVLRNTAGLLLLLLGVVGLVLPVLQGVVIFGAIAIIIFSLVVDILYAWIDPRIRLT